MIRLKLPIISPRKRRRNFLASARMAAKALMRYGIEVAKIMARWVSGITISIRSMFRVQQPPRHNLSASVSKFCAIRMELSHAQVCKTFSSKLTVLSQQVMLSKCRRQSSTLPGGQSLTRLSSRKIISTLCKREMPVLKQVSVNEMRSGKYQAPSTYQRLSPGHSKQKLNLVAD